MQNEVKMLFLGQYKDEISERDLQGLIGVTGESIQIDFKRDDYQVKSEELAKDVASFANSKGGLIICGMSEKDGLADDIIGLGSNTNPDKACLRLQQIIWQYPV